MATIGIFDSGVGGLSVYREIRRLLPAEKYIYFADNAFCPYGEKSPAFIRARAREITELLRGRKQADYAPLLAVIDETQAKNALATTKATLDQALDAQQRMKQLHDNQSLPDMKWVEVESKVAQAQAAYDMAKKNLEDCRIYAPVSGVVGTKIMGVGETVLPTEPVLTILSIDRVKVRVAIPEREISSITAGTATTISVDALQDETFQGGRIEKGVSADPMTHTYDIRILVPNPGHKLLPGMVARIQIKNEKLKIKNEGLTLPVKAVQQSTDKSLFVWVAREGKAHRQTVTIGQTVGNRVVIESGLKENAPVIVEGYQKLGEGTPVEYGME